MRVRVAVVIAALAVSIAAVGWADQTFHGYQIVKVMLNGREVESDVPAVNFHGRTMLPVRKLAEVAGLTVDNWDAATNTVYLSSGAPSAVSEDQVVATVNGEKITRLELYNRMVAQSGATVVDALISERLIAQAALQAGVTVTTEEIDQEVAKVTARIGSEERFQEALAQNNLTLGRFREQLSIQIMATKVLGKEITVRDEDVKKFFADHLAQFDKRQVHARHILVATEQEARDLKAQLDKGADFATLAREKSTDPTAKANSGDLGSFGPGMMVPEFEKAVFSLKAGELSQPFQTAFGWHVAQVLEIKGSAPDFEAMKAEVTEAYLTSQVQARTQPWLKGLHDKATIANTLEKK